MAREAALSELHLIELVRKNDCRAMEQLYRSSADYLAAVCGRYIVDADDVADVLQESFLKIFSSISQFDYRAPGSLKGWMARIVVNEALDFLKRSSRFTAMPADYEPDVDDADPPFDDVPVEAVYAMIRQLPVGYRTVFNLYVFEEKSHREIASILNIKESTSASQLHRAKAMLTNKIKDYKLTAKK